jgi:hypothetical protein
MGGGSLWRFLGGEWIRSGLDGNVFELLEEEKMMKENGRRANFLNVLSSLYLLDCVCKENKSLLGIRMISFFLWQGNVM